MSFSSGHWRRVRQSLGFVRLAATSAIWPLLGQMPLKMPHVLWVVEEVLMACMGLQVFAAPKRRSRGSRRSAAAAALQR